MDNATQDGLLATFAVLREFGPQLGRPRVDTLKATHLAGLKELRKKTVHILFVFDPERRAVLLLGGDKIGDKRWYRRNIPIAEKRYRRYLETLDQKP